MSAATYLDQLLEPMTEAFSSEGARRIAGLRADPELQARVDVWADKANQGTLTPEEEREYNGYIEAADVIGIIQPRPGGS